MFKPSDGELKIWLEPEVEIDKIYNVKPKEVSEILDIVKEHKNEFIKKWEKHFKF